MSLDNLKDKVLSKVMPVAAKELHGAKTVAQFTKTAI